MGPGLAPVRSAPAANRDDVRSGGFPFLTQGCQDGRFILHCIIDSDLPKLQLFKIF